MNSTATMASPRICYTIKEAREASPEGGFRSIRWLYDRMLANLVAYVRLSSGCLLILVDDLEAMNDPAFGRCGLDTVAGAFPGRTELRPAEVGAALGVTAEMIQRQVRSGALPASPIGLGKGKRTIKTEDLKRFLLERRVPARWESA